MQSTTMVFPSFTEVCAIQSKFETQKFIRMSTVDDYLSGLTDRLTSNVIFDFTFDLFSRKTTPEYFYTFFADIQPILTNIRLSGIGISIIRNYPFTTNISSINMKQKILDQFVELLIEFMDAKIILIPTIISRYCFNRLTNPVIEIINLVRLGKAGNIKLSDNSRFSIIYAIDLVTALVEHLENDENGHDLVIEGNELSLKEVFETGQDIAGSAPLRFENTRFVKYHFPDICGKYVNHIHYEFSNMMVDLVNNLF